MPRGSCFGRLVGGSCLRFGCALGEAGKAIVSYADSASGSTYNIKGHGKTAPLNLILSAGQ